MDDINSALATDDETKAICKASPACMHLMPRQINGFSFDDDDGAGWIFYHIMDA